jgi:hypothetical protein
LIITFIPINRYIDDIKNKKYKRGVHGSLNESITLTTTTTTTTTTSATN